MTSPGDFSRGRPVSRPRALVFGDRAAPYHPLDAVEPVFRAIFAEDFDLGFTTTPHELIGIGDEVSLVVGYADAWETPLSDDEARGLAGYVERGGGLLILHNGVCWAKHPRLLSLIGAEFAGHPEPTMLDYSLGGAHPIAQVESFQLQEEPYRYTFTAGFGADVFMHYSHEGRLWPAGWARESGRGRIGVLQPGHRAAAFENPLYAALARRSALWCAHRLPPVAGIA